MTQLDNPASTNDRSTTVTHLIHNQLDVIEATAREGHSDAGRLIDALKDDDARIQEAIDNDEDGALPAALAGLVDGDALFGAAMFRAAEILVDLTPNDFLGDPQGALAAIWADGAMAGIEFQRRGGHQEA